MAKKSRLERIEKQKATRSAFLYVVLTFAGVYLLYSFGISAISQTLDFLNEYTSGDKPKVVDQSIPPVPPRMVELPRYINDDKITVRGYTIPGYDILVFVNGEDYQTLANAEGEYSVSVSISQSEPNTIYSIAKAPNGLESSESERFIVEYDNESPEVEIIAPGDEIFGETNRQARIEGQTEPGASVKINGRVAIVRSDGKFEFNTRLEDGENIFKIVVLDEAGNQTETEKKINFIR